MLQDKSDEQLLHYKNMLEIKEHKLKNIVKTNKILEKKILKVMNDIQCKDQDTCQKKVQLHVDNDQNIQKNNELNPIYKEENKTECLLTHCSEYCNVNSDMVKNLLKENLDLKNRNIELNAVNKQIEKEMVLLSKTYNNLTQAFMDCQNKLLLLSARLNEGSSHELMKNPISNMNCNKCKFNICSI